jgi:hypothetical protein
MNDRDKFAAAALTGLLAGGVFRGDEEREKFCAAVWALADAMLAARGTTAHDAAPAATASEAENQAVCRRAETSAGEAGTGDTRVEAAAEVVYRAIMYDRGILYGWLASKSSGTVYDVRLFDIDGAMTQHSARAAAQKILAITPPAVGVTLTDDAVPLDSDILEAVAKVVYEAMLAAASTFDRRPAPPWVHGGNSLAQDEARDAARKILAMVPPAPGPTLTDAQREVLITVRDIYSCAGDDSCDRIAATIDGLLAQTAGGAALRRRRRSASSLRASR